MTNKPYNGWYNYETWNAALWLDNDYGAYSYLTDEAQRCYDENDGDECSASSDLEKIIESQFEQEAKDNSPKNGWMSDAINTYLGEVDFREIAEHYMNDVEKKTEEEEES